MVKRKFREKGLRMTEKRYILCETGDETPNWIKDNGELLYENEVVNRLNEQHETIQQLQGDCTTLVYSNQDYRYENENLKKQLDYIQNSINEHIKHQKTELAAKALKEIIEDYNEWMLGHKELKE